MVPPVYTCLKELLINAVKANFKNIYFEGYSSKKSSESIIDYELALKLFKLELSRENARHLERLARMYDMKAEVTIQTMDNKLYITVINPVEMTEREKNNVQYKLECGNRYNDIAEYFAENDNDVSAEADEGAGLGIILISLMLKSMGAGNRDFVITSENKQTTAVLKIPLG
jgi:acid phosphatase class B